MHYAIWPVLTSLLSNVLVVKYSGLFFSFLFFFSFLGVCVCVGLKPGLKCSCLASFIFLVLKFFICLHLTACVLTKFFYIIIRDSLFLLFFQYILKDKTKNTSRKDKSTFIVVPRREDQLAASTGKETSENETGI